MAFSYSVWFNKTPLPKNRWERYSALARARFDRISALVHNASFFGDKVRGE